MSVLDFCAGRGGKSAVLSEHLSLETFEADLTVGVGDLARVAPTDGHDVVMVDAPCSGPGTLAHRPDLMLRLRDASAWKALTAVQTVLLERAAGWVKPGGVLLYAVCTLTSEEADAPVEALLARHTDCAAQNERTVLRLDSDGTDGFVIDRIVCFGPAHPRLAGIRGNGGLPSDCGETRVGNRRVSRGLAPTSGHQSEPAPTTGTLSTYRQKCSVGFARVGLANPTGHFRRRVRAVPFSTQWEPPISIQRRSARKLSFLGPRLCDGFRVCVSAELRAFPASLVGFRGGR